jgi:hypothetical protein
VFVLNTIVAGSGYTILSIVDEEAVGRVERDTERGIIIDLSSEFYKGRRVTESEAIKAIANHDMIILAGDRAVALGIELGIVHPDSVLEINGLKYVQVMKSYI